MKRLLLITSNHGKFGEAKSLARTYGYTLLEGKGVEKFEIQTDHVGLVSVCAAIDAYNHIHKPVLVDDTGMFVLALRGFPGVYSSYVFKTIGKPGLLRLLDGITDRRAYFETVVTYFDGSTLKSAKGRVSGHILFEEKGVGGFGFDAIFSPTVTKGSSFAQMGKSEKNNVSHRGKAFSKMFAWLSEHGLPPADIEKV